jgi:hypothetical protein
MKLDLPCKLHHFEEHGMAGAVDDVELGFVAADVDVCVEDVYAGEVEKIGKL